MVAAAKQLGDLEEQKARMAEVPPTMAGEVQAARIAWVRIVNLFVANAEAAGLEPDTDKLLFSALRAAERAAEGRIRRPSPAPAPAPAVTPAKEPGPTSKSWGGRAAAELPRPDPWGIW